MIPWCRTLGHREERVLAWPEDEKLTQSLTSYFFSFMERVTNVRRTVTMMSGKSNNGLLKQDPSAILRDLALLCLLLTTCRASSLGSSWPNTSERTEKAMSGMFMAFFYFMKGECDEQKRQQWFTKMQSLSNFKRSRPSVPFASYLPRIVFRQFLTEYIRTHLKGHERNVHGLFLFYEREM